MCLLFSHDLTPGRSAVVPQVGADSAIKTPIPCLTMFVHPQCPCSEASLTNLATLMDRCGDRVHADVYLFCAAGQLPDWEKSSLWLQAKRIPGVDVEPDPDARIAKQWGAITSGSQPAGAAASQRPDQ